MTLIPLVGFQSVKDCTSAYESYKKSNDLAHDLIRFRDLQQTYKKSRCHGNLKKKSSPVHNALTMRGPEEESIVRNLTLVYKRLFSGLEPVTSMSQDNNIIIESRLPFVEEIK